MFERLDPGPRMDVREYCPALAIIGTLVRCPQSLICLGTSILETLDTYYLVPANSFISLRHTNAFPLFFLPEVLGTNSDIPSLLRVGRG